MAGAALVLPAQPVQADPVRIVFFGVAKRTGRINYDMEGNANLPGIVNNVYAGDSASTVANALKDGINSAPLNTHFVATSEVNPVSGNVIVIITPKPGEKNFTKIKLLPSDPNTPNKDSGMNSEGSLVSAAPGRAELQLLPSYELADPAVDWHLMVLDQDQDVIAQSDHLNVASSVNAQDLISGFAQDLQLQGIPVVAIGDTLSLQTNNNLVFFPMCSGYSPWQAVTLNEAIPEPSALALMIAAMLPLTTRRFRNRHKS
jgi:hypothetical protein